MKPVEAIQTTELFPELHSQLVHLLKELSQDDWQKSTACSPWSVKDVAAHLLDGSIRRLSFQRDKLSPLEPERPIVDQKGLINFLNQLNAEWVTAAKRFSPELLIEFLDLTGPLVHQLFIGLSPYEPALYSVAWAGDESSPNWFDVAREYTEQWLHQQHIREAVNRPGVTAPHQMYPVLDTFMRALPFTYRHIESVNGVSMSVIVEGGAGGEWSLLRDKDEWHLYRGADINATTRVYLTQDTAWRLFTNGMGADEARNQMRIEGDKVLGSNILQMVSIMA